MAVFSRILKILFQILQNPVIFVSFILKINPFLHVYYIKLIKNIYLFTNFKFLQKFSVKSQIFVYIEIVPIMYEWGEVKKITGNKILLRSILEQCAVQWNLILLTKTLMIIDYVCSEENEQMCLTKKITMIILMQLQKTFLHTLFLNNLTSKAIFLSKLFVQSIYVPFYSTYLQESSAYFK